MVGRRCSAIGSKFCKSKQSRSSDIRERKRECVLDRYWEDFAEYLRRVHTVSVSNCSMTRLGRLHLRPRKYNHTVDDQRSRAEYSHHHRWPREYSYGSRTRIFPDKLQGRGFLCQSECHALRRLLVDDHHGSPSIGLQLLEQTKHIGQFQRLLNSEDGNLPSYFELMVYCTRTTKSKLLLLVNVCVLRKCVDKKRTTTTIV